MPVLACLSRSMTVALLAEGVDRNVDIANDLNSRGLSPSSRRAWIEMPYYSAPYVAGLSPSSRRAWIEIHRPGKRTGFHPRRPPRGGRG